MGRAKVELYARIREDHRLLGLGVRALARRHGVHRRMVREALACPVPAPRKTPVRASPVLDSVAGLIDAMLREDLDAPRKQRHTSRRIWQRLADEHGAVVSYSYVSKYAGLRRAQIEAEHRAAAGSAEGFVPQAKEPGAEAEVDFGPAVIVIGGDQVACQLFAYRLSFSGLGVHRVYASCAQEAFLEGHVTAFEVTGGVPWRHIRYDNLSPAVARVMTGRDRKETSRWSLSDDRNLGPVHHRWSARAFSVVKDVMSCMTSVRARWVLGPDFDSYSGPLGSAPGVRSNDAATLIVSG